MNSPICSRVSTIFDGSQTAYIYIWVSKRLEMVYVGETNDRYGTLGRAAAHVRTGGTLRQRVEEITGEQIELTDDWHLLSYPLPQERKFISNESGYREAVEYLVQTKLIGLRSQCQPIFRIVSNVRPSDRTTEWSTIELANKICEDFILMYNTSL